MAHPGLAAVPAVILVAIGGALGASARWGIDRAIAADAAGVAWEIVVVNIVGAFALGAVTGWHHEREAPAWMPLVGPGFLGAFTTYSTAAAALFLIDANATAVWGVLIGTIFAAVAAAGAGWVWTTQRHTKAAA